MSDDFFKDLKVIELASVLAGPSVGLFFAEQGAQVLKIENKKNGRRCYTILEIANRKSGKFGFSLFFFSKL